MTACPNCSAEMPGAWCGACGQKRIDEGDLSLRHFFRQLVEEFTAVGEMKAVRTLRALLVPGRLTAEHLAGRRQRSLGPLKLYFVCAAIFFLASPWVGFSLTALIERDHTGELGRLVTARLAETGASRELFTERFDSRVQTVYTLGATLCVLAAAALLHLLARRGRREFGVHLVFALHYLALLFLLSVVSGVAIRQFHAPYALAVGADYVVLGAWLFLALRRVFGESPARTAFETVALLGLTWALFDLVGAGAIWLTLRLA